jgi:hypothetical protein
MSETLTQTLARAPLAAGTLARGDALPVLDVSATGISKDAAALLSSMMQALATRSAQANSSGNTTVTPGALAIQHTEVITFSGSGSTTRIVILSTVAAPLAGIRCAVRCVLPATAEITVEFRNATDGGTLITSLVTDGSGDDAVLEFEGDGTVWNFLKATIPANA